MRPFNIKCTATWDTKGLKLPRWDIFGLPLIHRVNILIKIKLGTTRIIHHKSIGIGELNSGALKKFIKTDLKNLSKISHIKQFTMKIVNKLIFLIIQLHLKF